MATIKDFVGWLRADLSRWTRAGDSVEYVGHTGQSDGTNHAEEMSVRIYTRTNSYAIRAVEKNDGPGYLGCISKNRMPRAGEDQHRGNDLADGPLTRETWIKILVDIVAYELVEVHGRGLPPIEQFAAGRAAGGPPAAAVPSALGCSESEAREREREFFRQRGVPMPEIDAAGEYVNPSRPPGPSDAA